MSPTVERVAEEVVLGEGPHWDADQQCLYYVSIFDHTIHKYAPATGKETRTKLNGNVGFIVPVAGTKDQFVVGIVRNLFLIRWDGENHSKVEYLKLIAEVDHEPGYTGNRFNDAKSDQKGRLYAGTMGKEDPPGVFDRYKGSFYRFDGNGATKVFDKIDISNGLCWDIKNKYFYYIDSFEYAIRRYDYDFETASITNKKMVFDFKSNGLDSLPDGMTIDAKGNLWIACFDGSQVIQVDPTKGKILQAIKIPALQVTSVAFGGKNLDELYVTTASMNRTAVQPPPCGSLFKITGHGAKGYPGDPCVL